MASETVETMGRTYTLDGELLVGTLDEFLAANDDAFSDDDVARARTLQPGESMIVGGGAGAEFTLRCEVRS